MCFVCFFLNRLAKLERWAFNLSSYSTYKCWFIFHVSSICDFIDKNLLIMLNFICLEIPYTASVNKSHGKKQMSSYINGTLETYFEKWIDICQVKLQTKKDQFISLHTPKYWNHLRIFFLKKILLPESYPQTFLFN